MRKKLIVMADIITLLMMTGCGGFTKNGPGIIVTAGDAIRYMEDKYNCKW
jgi:hypothetical protein